MARPKEHKPEDILAAAITVFHQEGINVPTAQIAKAARVSNGSLFNYFPTKQALIDALYLSIKSDLVAAVGQLEPTEPIEVRMRQIWQRWLGWARAHPDAHRVVNLLGQSGMITPEASATGEALLSGPVAVLDEAFQAGLLVDLPLEHLGSLIQHHLDQAVASNLDDAQAAVAFDVLWNGITKQPIPTKG